MRTSTKGKRFLAFLLAAVLMLSVCPVTASAEDTKETTEIAETTVATETPETTVSPEPSETTAATEPPETTAATESPETTAATESPETTAATEPPETTAATELPETTVATEPEESTEATEPEEVSEAVKAFLDAVAAIKIPDEINEETGPVLNEQIGAAADAYEQLTVEELAREDVQAAAAVMQQAMNFLTGGMQTLETTYVAKIGEEEYETLDKAVAAAADGATIELLSDATTEGLNLSKDLTIQAAEGVEKPTITFTKYGIALWGKALTFRKVNVVMNGIGSTPYTGEWNWMTICASKNASLSLDNATMTMDGANAGNKHAIYFCSNNKLNLTNGSVLSIKNYQQDALEWDGGDGGYNVNITNSTFISDHNRSGFTGTFYATIDNSTVKVINSLGNGSNGTYYTIKNRSNVLFDGNTNWGISAWRIDMTDNSTLMATNNGYSGIWTRVLNVDGTCTLDVEGNGNNAYAFTVNAGIFFQGNGTYTSTIEKGANVTIKNNAGAGIYTKQTVCNLTIHSATIVNNGSGNVNKQDVGATYGGGIYNIGTMNLDADVVLYNNHADTAGDDIYNTGTITFGKVGSDWALDGAPDCTDAIDGWYYDGYRVDGNDTVSTRWNAHSAPYVHEYTDFTGNVTNAKGTLALKAAHGLETNPDVQPSGPAPDWGNSKSKTATNLDKNFESKVTLSLPAASYKGNLDVAFVLDGSTSADQQGLAGQAAALLEELAEMENLNVKASLTIFGGSVPILENTGLLDISDAGNLAELTNKLTDPSYDKKDGRSGSNLQAGVEAANAKLTADNGVDSADKYLIILSDGAARMWYKNGSAMSQAYNPNGIIFWNSNEDFRHRYGTNAEEEGKLPLRSFNDVWAAGQSGAYIGRYGMTEAEKDAADKDMVASWETVAKASDYYTTYEAATYYAAGSIIKASQNSHVIFVSYPYHSDKTYGIYTESFKAWLASNNYVTRYDGDTMGSASVFDAVKKDLIQVVDAGSKVVDVIGYGDDYDFRFVNDIKALTMTVGGKELAVSEIDDTTYGFGWNGKGYDFVLHYYPNGNGDMSDEHFVWDINVPVTKDETVQLTYTVKLANPKTDPGTYGIYDADGSNQTATALYTNNSATLYPVDSNGTAGKPQDFPKPTVSYTVEKTEPEPTEPEPTEPGPTEPEPTEPAPTEPEPDYGKLTIEKSANRTTVRPGKTITYTIKVTNNTGMDLEDIAVSEVLDGNLIFVSSSGDGNYAVKDGLWTISELKNGRTAKLTIKATVKSGVKDGTVIKNTAVITEAGDDPVPGNPSDSVKVKVSNKISLIPQTGDTSNIGLWIGVLLAAAVALCAVLIVMVKKKKTR